MEAEIERVIEQGHRNAKAMTLIKKHCSHARVELSPLHGISAVEGMTGLPISVREMRCQFAPTPTSIAHDLLENGTRFYEQNCDGCPHRDVQDVPNLKTVAEERIAERERKRQVESEAQRQQENTRAQRATARAKAVANETQDTRSLVSLVDGIDAETPDDRGAELIDLCRLRPELCTPAAALVLLDAAEQTHSDTLFAALIHLDDADRLPRDRLLQVALRALSGGPLSNAATVVRKFDRVLQPGDLQPIALSAIRLAAPPHDIGLEPTGDPTLLKLLAANELPALLDEMVASIGADSTYQRRVGAGAAAKLIELDPATVEPLLNPLIDALSLPESLSIYLGSPREELLEALTVAFVAKPELTAEVIEARAPRETDEVRSALFHVFDGAIREGRKGAPVEANVVNQVLDGTFRRLDGDWGSDVSGEAATLISNTARWEPELMSARVDQLFGALLTATAAPAERLSPLELPSDQPPLLQFMEVQNREMARSATIRDLREAVGHLADHAPDAVANNVFSVIEAPELVSEEAQELRDEAVRLLGSLGRRPELLPKVLPALWTALLHGEQRVRARAIEAWTQIARVSHRELPQDLGDLVPRLLQDRYTIVHTAMITGLREGVRIPEAQLGEAIAALLALSEYYAERDSNILEMTLEVLWSAVGKAPVEVAESLRERSLQFAKHLRRYPKENFLERHAREARGLPSYPVRLIEVLSDPSRDKNGPRGDQLIRELRDLPAEAIQSHADRVVAAARAQLPQHTRRAQPFVEVLQRAGLWSEARALAEEIVEAVPDTTEHAIERDQALSVLASARAEEQSLPEGPTRHAIRCERWTKPGSGFGR